MSVPIYQFCRGFDNVRYSEVYKCHVSGGYPFEKIARASHEVPPEIREAVIDDYFKLNDNYPPDQDDFSLIAREINDKYSVLAVANRQLDDGGRPTIGYKYFWLEKSSPDIDGIGTLIYWWSHHRQPKFAMAELVETSLPEIFYYDLEYQKTNFQESWLQETWKTVEKLSAIPHTVVVTKELWQQQYPEYIKLHYLALGLSFRANHTNSLNAWAWNVQKLAHPDSFISIFYATQEDIIPSNIRKRNLPGLNLVSPQTHNPNDLTPDKAQPESPTPLPSKTSNSIPPAMEKNIKLFLSSLANTVNQNGLDVDEKIQELFGYLRDYADADWTNCIDKTRVTTSSPHEIYPQLIYLVEPNNKLSENWLLKMVQSIDTKKTSPRILEFQRVLLEFSFKYEDSLVKERLISSIYTGISYLLNQLISTDKVNNKIEFLLTESKSVWSKTFFDYAELVKKRIFSKTETIVEESMETFCQEISTLLERPQNISLAERKQYKKLASTFIKIKYYSLAGTFYYIADKCIPPFINDSIDIEILRRIYNIKSHKADSPPKNNNEPQANKSKDDESKDDESQDDKSQYDESQDDKSQYDESQDDEARSKKTKNNSIILNQIQSQPIQDNPSRNEDNTQVSILCTVFLVVSILFKACESIIRPDPIFLLPISIIYSILSVIVIYLTLNDFFRRRNRRFNRIIGSSLAIIYICIFVAIMRPIVIIPISKSDPSQLATQQTQKSNNNNNVTDTNSKNTSTNSATPSASNISSGCATDVLSNLEVFKACNKSDKDKLEVELRNNYKLFSTAIAENLRKYYLSSKDENQFQDRKFKIQKCQNDNPIKDDANGRDNLNNCIKDITQKSPQPKR
jgi:hypothetical protein